MSPLAPQLVNGNRSFDSSTPSNLIEIVSKQTYSVGSLYDMRHNQSRAPNLGNRNVLASISRPNVTPSLRLPGAFRLSLSTPSLNQFERDPRPSNHQRPIARHNSTQGNGNRSNSGDSHGERYRPANRDRNHTVNGTNSSIQIRMSIKRDVKLCEAKNAWKPSFLQQKHHPSNENDTNIELYKQVRSILNKLTAQNFTIMLEQFQHLHIDTKDKLVNVIQIIFDKAVNEANFSEGYAKLCQHLSHCSEQIDSSSTERAYFKRTLINKCQIEFEQHVANKNATEAALVPLHEQLKSHELTGNANGVNEIKAQIAEEESILRRRLVSTVRFIGELYKLNMLTTNIMNHCINTLITEAINGSPSHSSQRNEKLECLCKLLTTVGGKLEHKITNDSDATTTKPQYLDLSNYMNQLKRIADNKIRNFKPSTRIKFMIMDVIELRNNRWMPKIKYCITKM